MARLALAIAVFLAVHALPSTPLRPWLIARIGRRAFMWTFSGLSLVLLAWVWAAYRQAEVETVFWVTGPAVRLVSAGAMLVAVLLLVAALTARPRVLLTGETVLAGPDAVQGVLRITRHPILWAVGLWGLVHVVNNADGPSWLFFGVMTVLALAGTLAVDRRRRRLLGEAWPRLARDTSNLPFAAIAGGRNRLALAEIGPLPLLLGFALWVGLLALHAPVLGVPPLGL